MRNSSNKLIPQHVPLDINVAKKSSKSYADIFSREKQIISQIGSKHYFDRRFLSLPTTAKKCDDNQNVAKEKNKSNLEVIKHPLRPV